MEFKAKVILWLFGMACYFIGFGWNALLNRINGKSKRKTKVKPIIRHCFNCEYFGSDDVYDCGVKYKDVECPRTRALFCRFYTQEEEGGAE